MRKPKPALPLWVKNGKRVWVEIRDKQELDVLEFLEGNITEADHETKHIKVQFASGEAEREVRGDRIHERLEEHGIVEDLANIPLLNDAELLKHLELRYKKDLIHIYCGPTLVVTNPYKYLEHESSDAVMEEVAVALKEKRLASFPPHVWALSAKCYEKLFALEVNQAICISGESGAGKTECTKRCLEFITTLKVESKSLIKVPIEDKILSCNPLLEAFGNAKTVRNDNSSRFGKYTVLFIHKVRKTVKGASIENYLLEKSRVVALGEGERNYHIFYAFCRFAPKDVLQKYLLINEGEEKVDLKRFHYLNQSGVYETPKVDDEEFYMDVCKSFHDLDFPEEHRDAIWRILSAVLHLGNLEVDDSSYEEGAKPCKIRRTRDWKNVVDLLGVDEEMFEEALTHKELKIGTSVTKSPLSPKVSRNNVDSIAKELYNRTFTWIVTKLNKTLLPESPEDSNFMTIGVLDIFGFEIFDKNSIEQFFINYANERLQSLYISYIFENEKKVFIDEGLAEFTRLIHYTDNKPVVSACDSLKPPLGVFNLVDMICSLNKSDENLHAEIVKAHKNSEIVTFPKFAKNLSFNVKHTARTVSYLTDNFVEKNKDELSLFLEGAVRTAKPAITSIFFNELVKKNPDQEGKRKNPKEKYLGYKFKMDMNNLVDQLSRCYCHFIRCIKPNERKKAGFWNAQLALQQVRYMGLLDSLNVRKQSYPYRFAFHRFFNVYQDLDQGEHANKSYPALQQQGADFRKLAEEVIETCNIDHDEKDILYGKTKILLNEKFKLLLDKALDEKQEAKKEKINVLEKAYADYNKKSNVDSFFEREAKSIAISRDLLKSWTAKIDGMRFKNFIDVVRRLQNRFRFIQQKRMRRFKAQNMGLITRYLGLYKFTKVNHYVIHYKRKVLLMQALLDKKIKDAKSQFCRNIVQSVFKKAWEEKIMVNIVEQSIVDIQSTFRNYLLRKRRLSQYMVLKEKLTETSDFNSSTTFQRLIRGHLVRYRVQEETKAAVRIQSYFRTLWLREYFLRIVRAVAVIQRFFRKLSIRKAKVDVKLHAVLEDLKEYDQKMAKIESNILFGNNSVRDDIEELNTIIDMPALKAGNFDPGRQNYRSFVPKVPHMDLNPKAKFVSLPVDLKVHIDTTPAYNNSWGAEFVGFMNNTHDKGSRLLHVEVGGSFTMAVTDDKEVYAWGANDYNQCGREGPGFSVGQAMVKNLSVNAPKFISAGRDHGVMVGESGDLFAWGKNEDGQLGNGENKTSNKIHVLNNNGEKVRALATKEDTTYILNKSGKVLTWPSEDKEQPIYSPVELEIPSNITIVNISAGSDFALFLTKAGQIYGRGENAKGQLGVGDFRRRKKMTLIKSLKDSNEKILEVSCGFKHVICRSVLGKTYTWGANESGQLGTGTTTPVNSPYKIALDQYKKIRAKPRSVQAGRSCSFLMMDDQKIYAAGKKGLNFERFRLPAQVG